MIDEGWVAAGDLVVGDEVYNLDGTTSVVIDSEVEKLDEPVLVYNLEVEDLHSYFVGCVPVLVHNYNYNDDDYDDLYDDMFTKSNNKYKSKNKSSSYSTPLNNQNQNAQFNEVCKRLGLNKEQARRLHDKITGKGLGFDEFLDFAKSLFDK